MLSLTLHELASYLECEYQGDGSSVIDCLATLDKTNTTSLSFLHQDNYLRFLPDAQGTVILSNQHGSNYPGNAIISETPYLSYAKAAEKLREDQAPPLGIHPSAVIAESAQIGEHVSIAAHVVVGENTSIADGVVIGVGANIESHCTIGLGCQIRSNSCIRNNCTIGCDVVIEAGSVIGSDGFGFARDGERWVAIPQLGGVVIGDRTRIGANCTVDAGAINPTHIDHDVIIDNLVQVAHNVTIGSGTAIAACVGISGSTSIGKNCMIGGQTGIAGHLTITDNVILLAKTQVTKSIPKAGVYSSIIGFQVQAKWNKNAARLRQLDRIMSQIQTRKA